MLHIVNFECFSHMLSDQIFLVFAEQLYDIIHNSFHGSPSIIDVSGIFSVNILPWL